MLPASKDARCRSTRGKLLRTARASGGVPLGTLSARDRIPAAHPIGCSFHMRRGGAEQSHAEVLSMAHAACHEMHVACGRRGRIALSCCRQAHVASVSAEQWLGRPSLT
jgi:hypothetical protein